MTPCARRPGAGLRRFDQHSASALDLADQFAGLDLDVLPAHVLSALKRAAVYLNYPRRVVQLIDLCFSWTQPQDWRNGHVPVVWPSNDKLAQLLGVTVRQVQKLLTQAQALGFIAFRDSPNGHRGGHRTARGDIKWAYGVVLSPLGARYREFLEVIAHGTAADKRLDELQRRLAAARRAIRTIAQAALDAEASGFRPEEEIALARMAAEQIRGSRDVAMVEAIVDQLESRRRLLEKAMLEAASDNPPHGVSEESSCADDLKDTHSTTTNQLQSATADYSNGSAEKSSDRGYDVRTNTPQTSVEADLEKHGVDPGFVREIAPDLLHQLDYGPATWGNIVALAERLAGQHRIPISAWREACRIMGQKGAAAAVIATIEKHRAGDVLQPGAYLRGMSKKAAAGELNLGKTLYGLKDHARSEGMRTLASGSVGFLANRLLHRAAAARGPGSARP